MPSNCVICGNSAIKDPGVSFHRLPSSAERKRQWLTAFDVTEDEWCTHWRVCSRHFPDGNPKAAPHSYQEDQFATMWAMRKRAKLDQSRVATSRQLKRSHVNSIIAMRARHHGTPPRPFPVINTTTSTPNSSSSVATEDQRPPALHSRVPPMLLPVVSLENHATVSGPVAVITTDPRATHEMQPLERTAGIHVHELVVVPELSHSTDDASSESSGTDDSIPGIDVVTDLGESTVSRLNQAESRSVMLASILEHKGTSSADHVATSVVEHGATMTIHTMSCASDDNHASAVSRSDCVVSTPHPSDQSSSDVSVLVQSALLARITALDKDNQQLRQQHVQSTSPLRVQVMDSSLGRPAEGIAVQLSIWQTATAEWTSLSSGMTGVDGEWCVRLAHSQLAAGLYQLHFDTQSYFSSQGHPQPHYPYVEIVFCLQHATPRHRITLQLSPFSYTTSSQSL